MSHLLIVVDSNRVDPYLNSVVHCIRARNVTTVTFLHILGADGGDTGRTGQASGMLGAVRAAVQTLSISGVYDIGEVHAQVSSLNGTFTTDQVKAYYAPVDASRVSYQSAEVEYRNLRRYVKDHAKHHRPLILDVTTARKLLLGDFVSLALVDGIGDIFTFDLLDPPDFAAPWNSLIHSVDSSNRYRYVNILETQIFRDASRALLVRSPRVHVAWAISTLIIVAGVFVNIAFGMDSGIARWINVVATFATLAALVLVFFPPRAP